MDNPVSWAAEVVAESNGKWSRNALRFATEAEARASAEELSSRWFAVSKTRAAPTNEPVNYRFENGRNIAIKS